MTDVRTELISNQTSRVWSDLIRSDNGSPEVNHSPQFRSIAIVPLVAALAPLATQQLVVTATARIGGLAQVVTRECVYESSVPAVATVSQLGVVTAVAAGDTNITARYADISAPAPCVVTVA